MTQTQKIRVGLIGLNAPPTGTPTGTNWAANAHLPYLKTSSKYEIVALQNSSADRAKASIKAYDLDPQKVKAYGTPEEIAADPNIDLVVSSIRVDRHGNSVIPSIKAGKDVFVEWPLEANYTKAKELTDLVSVHKVRNVVGLQGSYAPVVQKIRDLIGEGEIGNVESSTFFAKNRSGATIPSHIGYFTDKSIGGNPFTIGFGHSLEFLREVLGEVSTYRSLLVNQHPEVSVVDPASNEIVSTVKNDVPTQIVFNAIMKSGAVSTYEIHPHPIVTPGRKPPKEKTDILPFDWRIVGTKGEIRITSESWALNANATPKLEICKADEGLIREVELSWGNEEHLPLAARNIARLYEAFAAGEDGERKKNWYPDFEYALKSHKLIEDMYKENGF